MSSGELLPHELMQILADFFESQHIQYRVVGSMASMAYGEPRFTNDIDIVAELKASDIQSLCESFRDRIFIYPRPLRVRQSQAGHSSTSCTRPQV